MCLLTDVNTNHTLILQHVDGEDFTGGDYTVEFQTLRVSSSVSSTAEIPKINDSIPEFTKSFICVILRPRGEDGIVVEDPTTITVVIEDDDCEYDSRIHVHTLYF